MKVPNDNNSSQFIAAADLGSNSFHLIIGKLEHGRFVVVDRIKEVVRLGAGLDDELNLTVEAQQRAITCLSEFGQRVRDIPSENIRAVGTNTFRKARNAENFMESAQNALGHKIEIITGREEARLIYTSVCYGISNDSDRKLVVDIGGGSTEVISGVNISPGSPDIAESFYIGCVSLSREYFPEGYINRERMHKALVDAKLEFRIASNQYRQLGWDKVIGCSGTIRAIAGSLRYLEWEGELITRSSLFELMNSISDLDNVNQLVRLGFEPDRCAVLPGGIAVLAALFETLEIDSMEVSEQALREGVIYDLLGRIQNQDIRSQTVQSLARTWSVDIEHATNVETTTLSLFDQVAEDWNLDYPEVRKTLSWAASLHEIGLSISHAQYHKHGAYVLENSDLAGFSRPEQTALARLVRGHRRKYPIKDLKVSTHLPDGALPKLCAILRIGVLLHRSRVNRVTKDIRMSIDDQEIHLYFPSGWLDEHPLTERDLTSERHYLYAAKFFLRVHKDSEINQ